MLNSYVFYLTMFDEKRRIQSLVDISLSIFKILSWKSQENSSLCRWYFAYIFLKIKLKIFLTRREAWSNYISILYILYLLSKNRFQNWRSRILILDLLKFWFYFEILLLLYCFQPLCLQPNLMGSYHVVILKIVISLYSKITWNKTNVFIESRKIR